MKYGDHPSEINFTPIVTRFESLIKGVLAVCVFFLCVFFVRHHLDDFRNYRVNDGELLSGMRKSFMSSVFNECRTETCSVAVVKVGAAVTQERRNLQGRLLVAPPTIIPMDAMPLVSPISFMPTDASDWVARQDKTFSKRTRLWSGWNLSIGQTDDGSALKIKVPSAGYISRMVVSEAAPSAVSIESLTRDSSTQRQALQRLAMSKRSTWRPTSVEFQGMPYNIRLAIESATTEDVALNDLVYLVFSSPTGLGASYQLETKVVSQGSNSTERYYEFRAEDEQADWLLDYFTRTNGRTPKTDLIEVKVITKAYVAPTDEMSIPKDAIVYETAGGKTEAGYGIVWVAFGGVALPIHVKVGQRINDKINVAPVSGPLIGAIRPEDWQLTPKAARTKIKVMVGAPGGAYLTEGVSVIKTPSQALTAGMAVRAI
jgi:hypothetical protein